MTVIHLQLSTRVKISKKLRLWLEIASQVASKELPKDVKIAHLNLLICGDHKMRSINREFRNKDKVTDVLSFPAQLNIRSGKKLDWIQPGEMSLGDLVISLPQASRQSKKFNLSLEEEVIHLYFHGLLHLYGYDHELSLKEEKLMETLEAKLLEKFSKKRAS